MAKVAWYGFTLSPWALHTAMVTKLSPAPVSSMTLPRPGDDPPAIPAMMVGWGSNRWGRGRSYVACGSRSRRVDGHPASCRTAACSEITAATRARSAASISCRCGADRRGGLATIWMRWATLLSSCMSCSTRLGLIMSASYVMACCMVRISCFITSNPSSTVGTCRDRVPYAMYCRPASSNLCWSN